MKKRSAKFHMKDIKAISKITICFLICISFFMSTNNLANASTKEYEADDALLNNCSIYTGFPNATDGECVGSIDYNDSYVEFSVSVSGTDTYSMTVRYTSGIDCYNSSHLVSINGGPSVPLLYQQPGWGVFTTVDMNIVLNEGVNTIRFTKGVSYAAIDNIEISDSVSGGQFSNPLRGGTDPYISYYDGYYYSLYSDGFNKLYISRSKSLTVGGELQLIYEFPKNQWNSEQLWGPFPLLKWSDNKWYVFYSASDGNNANHRQGVLVSDSSDPMGSYSDLGMINTSNTWAIGATPFKDLQGDWYLTWSGWRNNNDEWPQRTYIAPMTNPWTIGNRVEISSPDKSWEGINDGTPLQEGQSVYNLNGNLYLLYSANASWTDRYCLGMLTYIGGLNGDVLDPNNWIKSTDPILESTDNIKGPGGPTIVMSKDGTEYWLGYHSAQYQGSGWSRFTNLKKITFDSSGVPEFGEPVAYYVQQNAPSGELTGGISNRVLFEADVATINNAQVYTGFANASEGKCVGYIDYQDSYVEYNIHVPKSGPYWVTVRATTGVDLSTHLITVNDGTEIEINYVNKGWDNFVPVKVQLYLIGGNNTIKFSKGNGFASLDLIEISPANFKIYEAEDACVNDAAIYEHAEAFRGYAVGYIDYQTSYVEFTVDVPTTGNYDLYTTATGSNTNASHYVSINGGAKSVITYENNIGWDYFFETRNPLTVSLNAGINTIKYMKNNDYAAIDFIRLAPTQ